MLHEYHVVYSVRHYPTFSVTAVGLGTYYTRIRGSNCISFSAVKITPPCAVRSLKHQHRRYMILTTDRLSNSTYKKDNNLRFQTPILRFLGSLGRPHFPLKKKKELAPSQEVCTRKVGATVFLNRRKSMGADDSGNTPRPLKHPKKSPGTKLTGVFMSAKTCQDAAVNRTPPQLRIYPNSPVDQPIS